MQTAPASAPPPERRGRWQGWLTAIVLGVLINVFILTTVGISGSSMEPSLRGGERALVPRLEQWLNRLGSGTYGRGDIVFFRDPTARSCSWRCPYLIKRIVALPGETVEIRSGTVLIGGAALAEPYLADSWRGSFSMAATTVPADSYYVLGDNRYPYGSQDSRSFGPVPVDSVAGRASTVIWPPFRFSDGALSVNIRGL